MDYTLGQIDKKIKECYVLSNLKTYEVMGEKISPVSFTIPINGFQLDLLNTIANTEIDQDGNKIYIVNNLKFKLDIVIK